MGRPLGSKNREKDEIGAEDVVLTDETEPAVSPEVLEKFIDRIADVYETVLTDETPSEYEVLGEQAEAFVAGEPEWANPFPSVPKHLHDAMIRHTAERHGFVDHGPRHGDGKPSKANDPALFMASIYGIHECEMHEDGHLTHEKRSILEVKRDVLKRMAAERTELGDT